MTDPAADATGEIIAGIGVIIAGIEGIGGSAIVPQTGATGEMLDFNDATVGMTTFATGQTEGSMFVR